MRVVLLANPRSGRGRALPLRQRFRDALREAGYDPLCLNVSLDGSRPADDTVWKAERFSGATALVVFGGDGSVNAVAETAIRTDTPVYHVPMGNENLFARAFGMDRTRSKLVGALKANSVVRVDAARCNGNRFLIMASVGTDAAVIRRVAKARTKAIGHLTYVWPVLRQATKFATPSLTVEIDGRRVVDDQAGMVVVANSREYALRVDPATKASFTSGHLDMVFIPATLTTSLVWWYAKARARVHLNDPNLVYERGKHVRITGEDIPLQIDGEWPGDFDGPIDCEIEPAVLPVLKPVDA